MTKTKKPNRKFENRKAKIKQYATDMKMAIKEFVKETLIEGGVPEKQANKISLQAMKEEGNGIAESAVAYISLWKNYQAVAKETETKE